MSIAISTRVWANSKQKGSALMLLLAMADMANDAGVCWPSVRYLADKTRMTIRNVQKILRQLEADGELNVQVGGGARTPYGATNRYSIVLVNANEGSPQTRNAVHATGELDDTPGVNAATAESSSEPLLESSLETQTPTPARAHEAVGGGVHVELPELGSISPEQAQTRRDGSDLEGIDETRPLRVNAPTPIAPTPFPPQPDDTTEQWDTTEEETVSSGDTKPVDVPQWAGQINQPAPDIERLFAEHGDSLAGWYAYGTAADTIKNPVGFALAKVKQGLKPPASPSESYVPDRYADFIQH